MKKPRGKEKDCVQLAVRQKLQLLGYRVHRLTSDLRPGIGAHRADREPAGTPDLVAIQFLPQLLNAAQLIAHLGGTSALCEVLYIETKRAGCKLNPAQAAMHIHLRRHGYRVITVTGANAAEAVADLERQL